MRVKRNGTKYEACALCASRCEWSECPGHRKRGARWTGAAGSWFGAFFARTVRWKRQGLEVMNEWSGKKTERVYVCGGEAVWSETEHGCNHMDLWVGKDIYPESEMSGMERNERMNDSSCVRLAIAV